MIFRIPYPVLVSVVVGATNIIPFFGPIIGAVPWNSKAEPPERLLRQ